MSLTGKYMVRTVGGICNEKAITINADDLMSKFAVVNLCRFCVQSLGPC